ncbi:hypothetical protein LguiB_001681 [Lonicera macranthoides]
MQVDDLESINVCHSSRIERIEEELRSCPRGLHCKDEVDVASTSLLITLVRVFSQIEDAEDILWVVKAITARLIDCKIDQEQSCDCERNVANVIRSIQANKIGEDVNQTMQGVTIQAKHLGRCAREERGFYGWVNEGNNIDDERQASTSPGSGSRLDYESRIWRYRVCVVNLEFRGRVVFNADSVLGTDSRTSMNSQVTKPGNIAEDSSIEHFKTSHGYLIHPQGIKELVGSLETEWKTTNQYLLKEHAWLWCTRRCMFALVPQLNNLLMKKLTALHPSSVTLQLLQNLIINILSFGQCRTSIENTPTTYTGLLSNLHVFLLVHNSHPPSCRLNCLRQHAPLLKVLQHKHSTDCVDYSVLTILSLEGYDFLEAILPREITSSKRDYCYGTSIANTPKSIHNIRNDAQQILVYSQTSIASLLKVSPPHVGYCWQSGKPTSCVGCLILKTCSLEWHDFLEAIRPREITAMGVVQNQPWLVRPSSGELVELHSATEEERYQVLRFKRMEMSASESGESALSDLLKLNTSGGLSKHRSNVTYALVDIKCKLNFRLMLKRYALYWNYRASGD